MAELLDIQLYRRAFGDESDLSKPLSETLGFKLSFFTITASLFGSALWVATQGQTESPNLWVSVLSAFVISGSVLSVVWKVDSSKTPVKGLFYVLIAYFFLALIGRTLILQETQPALFGLLLIQGGSLGLMFAIFSRPILPGKLSASGISDEKERREAMKVHLGTQWKVGQIALTITGLTIGGLLVWTFPNGDDPVGRIRLFVSSLSVMVPLGLVLGYVLRKVFLIEKMIFDSY